MRLLFSFLFDKSQLFRYGVPIITIRRCFLLKGKRLLPLILLLLFILPVSTLAHPGGTDANGGHYDGSACISDEFELTEPFDGDDDLHEVMFDNWHDYLDAVAHDLN